MYPENPEENISARLIETVADGVCDAIVLVFLENARKEMLRSKDWIKRQERKIFEVVKIKVDVLKSELIIGLN